MRYMVSDRGFVRRSRRIGCLTFLEFTPRNNLAAEFGHAMKKVTSVTGLLYEAIILREIEKLHQNMYVQSHSEKVVVCNPRQGAFGAFHWSAESDCSNTVTATYSNHV